MVEFASIKLTDTFAIVMKQASKVLGVIMVGVQIFKRTINKFQYTINKFKVFKFYIYLASILAQSALHPGDRVNCR